GRTSALPCRGKGRIGSERSVQFKQVAPLNGKKLAGESHPRRRTLTGQGLAPALGLRAGIDGLFIVLQTASADRRLTMLFTNWRPPSHGLAVRRFGRPQRRGPTLAARLSLTLLE